MTPEAIQFREARIEDVDRIARVNSDTLRECGLATPEIYDIERQRNRWDGYMRGLQHPRHALAPRIVVAAFVEELMVGYIAGHFSRRHRMEGELQSLYVLKTHHGLGIGSALLIRLAEWFAANGRQSVCVGVDPANPYRRFYEKHGARYFNEHWLAWDDIRTVIGRQ
jgi:GNAT superfamily N-acetyltransferase